MRLFIAGAGGHGRVVAEAALATQAYSSLAFLDDRTSNAVTEEGWPIVGSLDRLEEFYPDFHAFVAGFGDAALRIDLLRRARRAGFRCASIIHPAATVSKHCSYRRRYRRHGGRMHQCRRSDRRSMHHQYRRDS